MYPNELYDENSTISCALEHLLALEHHSFRKTAPQLLHHTTAVYEDEEEEDDVTDKEIDHVRSPGSPTFLDPTDWETQKTEDSNDNNNHFCSELPVNLEKNGPYHATISSDRRTARYIGKANHTQDFGTVKADYPIPRDRAYYYFEVEILQAHHRSCVCIGLATKGFPLHLQPGTRPISYAYRGLDGRIFSYPSLIGRNTPASGKGKEYGPAFTKGDVIGCGVDFTRQQIFYTKNGKFLGVAFRDIFQKSSSSPWVLHRSALQQQAGRVLQSQPTTTTTTTTRPRSSSMSFVVSPPVEMGTTTTRRMRSSSTTAASSSHEAASRHHHHHHASGSSEAAVGVRISASIQGSLEEEGEGEEGAAGRAREAAAEEQEEEEEGILEGMFPRDLVYRTLRRRIIRSAMRTRADPLPLPDSSDEDTEAVLQRLSRRYQNRGGGRRVVSGGDNNEDEEEEDEEEDEEEEGEEELERAQGGGDEERRITEERESLMAHEEPEDEAEEENAGGNNIRTSRRSTSTFNNNMLWLLSSAELELSDVEFYPVVSLHAPGEEIRVNFGQEAFRYDVRLRVEEDRKELHACLRQERSVTPRALHALIKDYLLVQGYASTLDSFDTHHVVGGGGEACTWMTEVEVDRAAVEKTKKADGNGHASAAVVPMPGCKSSKLEQMVNEERQGCLRFTLEDRSFLRQEIVRRKDLASVIKFLESRYPRVVRERPWVRFELLCLQFIEMLVSSASSAAGLDSILQALNFARLTLAPFVLRPDHHHQLVKIRKKRKKGDEEEEEGKGDGNGGNNDDGGAFSSATVSSMQEDEEDEEEKEERKGDKEEAPAALDYAIRLRDVMGLVAYPMHRISQDEKHPLAYLLSKAHAEGVAELVNKAIIELSCPKGCAHGNIPMQRPLMEQALVHLAAAQEVLRDIKSDGRGKSFSFPIFKSRLLKKGREDIVR